MTTTYEEFEARIDAEIEAKRRIRHTVNVMDFNGGHCGDRGAVYAALDKGVMPNAFVGAPEDIKGTMMTLHPQMIDAGWDALEAFAGAYAQHWKKTVWITQSAESNWYFLTSIRPSINYEYQAHIDADGSFHLDGVS